MKHIIPFCKIIEGETESKAVFADCFIRISNNRIISFLESLDNYIDANIREYKLFNEYRIKAFIYCTIKMISRRKDLSEYGIKEIQINEI